MTGDNHLDPEQQERLGALFRDSADEPGLTWQPDTTNILARGRRAVRRRRLAAAVAGVCGAGVLTTGAIAVPDMVIEPRERLEPMNPVTTASRDASPTSEAVATASPSPTRTTAPAGWRAALHAVNKAEALERCRQQMSASYPDIPADRWQPDDADWGPGPRTTYRLGEAMSLVAGDVTTLCTVRGTWQPERPVDLTRPAPEPDDHPAILRLCSAQIGVDLRSWQVSAAMADGVGGLTVALSSPDGNPYGAGCNLQPSSWDIGIQAGTNIFGERPLAAIRENAAGDPVEWQVGLEASDTCTKSTMPCHGSMYAAAGVLPDGVSRLEFELPGGQTVAAHTADGLFAFRAVDEDDTPGLGDVWVTAYDREGTVLERFNALPG